MDGWCPAVPENFRIVTKNHKQLCLAVDNLTFPKHKKRVILESEQT